MGNETRQIFSAASDKVKAIATDAFPTYTAEEKDAIKKYRRSKRSSFLLMMIVMVCIGLLFSGLVFVLRSIQFSPMQGTYVLLQDYQDGFQPEDEYLEIAKTACYQNGIYQGQLKHEKEHWYFPILHPFQPTYQQAYWAEEQLTLTRRLPDPPAGTPTTQQRVYVRITRKSGLTEAQRDELY